MGVSFHRNEGLPLSLFHPFKRLPPEGTVSWGAGQVGSLQQPLCPPWWLTLFGSDLLQTLPVEEEICDPEEDLCKVGCAFGARAGSSRQRAAPPVHPPFPADPFVLLLLLPPLAADSPACI